MAVTFDGLPLFGNAVATEVEAGDAGIQYSAYPQLHGVEALALGDRGKVTMVSGILEEANVGAMLTALNLIENYRANAIAAAFVDSLGAGSTYAIILSWRRGRVLRHTFGYSAQIQAVIRHLL